MWVRAAILEFEEEKEVDIMNGLEMIGIARFRQCGRGRRYLGFFFFSRAQESTLHPRLPMLYVVECPFHLWSNRLGEPRIAHVVGMNRKYHLLSLLCRRLIDSK